MAGIVRIRHTQAWGALAAVFLLARPLPAERYALLIGVGNYSSFPAFHLEGPSEDVPAIRNALIRTWQFQEKNIRTLVDSEATKAHILEALDALVAEVKTGDKVFIYYSGHGTSALDPRNSWLGMPLHSGALVPSDVRKSPPANLLQQFIIGAIDLKPRLLALDSLASVFVVIDACYSGATVKSVADGLFTSRGVPLESMARGGSLAEQDYDSAYNSVHIPSVDADSYPYRQLIFLSAAAQSEKAYEANREVLRGGIFQTVDGKPHGLLTDSLLRAFRGEADENHDGVVTYEEVRRYALERVMNLGQTPQLLPGGQPDLTAQAVFGVAHAELPVSGPPVTQHQGVSVALSPGAQALAPLLSRLPEVRIAQGEAADLAIARAGDRYELYIANGVRIQQYSDAETPLLLERVRREPEIRTLREWVFPKQAFHAALEAEPADRDAYAVGESVEFRLRADRPSYFLLLNIDVSGEVTIVYKSPLDRPAAANRVLPVATCIAAPAGTEYMKLFAFAGLPVGWASLPVTGFPTEGPQFRRLIEWLQNAPAGSAQASWLTYSTDRRQPSRRCQ